jgi:hypothetical protein
MDAYPELAPSVQVTGLLNQVCLQYTRGSNSRGSCSQPYIYMHIYRELYIYIYIYIYLSVHTYIHTYIHTSVISVHHIYIHTYIHTYIYTMSIIPSTYCCLSPS